MGEIVLTLTESQLEEITKVISSKAVGRLMKRFELGGDLASIKANVKELAYELFRDYEDAVFSIGCGGHTTKFTFNKTDTRP